MTVRRHFLVIGAQRSGTSYLRRLLDAHPQVAMARPAKPEPKVFLTDEVRDRGADWYERTFFSHAAAESVYGEKSTSYLERPDAAARARDVLGEVDVVVLLRDPLERAVSNWRFSVDNGFETRDLVRALSDELARETRSWDDSATSVSPFAYLQRGRYAGQLQPWLSRFPAHVHVLFTQELLNDPTAISVLYAALGVEPTFRPPIIGEPINQSTTPVPTVPAELTERLRGYFADSDRELAAMLNRKLPWSTSPEAGLQ